MLQVPTHTSEDAAWHSRGQRHFRDQPVVAKECKTVTDVNKVESDNGK